MIQKRTFILIFFVAGLDLLSCDGWISFTAANAVVHTFWVTALLSCQLYQVITTSNRFILFYSNFDKCVCVSRQSLCAGSWSGYDDK